MARQIWISQVRAYQERNAASLNGGAEFRIQEAKNKSTSLDLPATGSRLLAP